MNWKAIADTFVDIVGMTALVAITLYIADKISKQEAEAVISSIGDQAKQSAARQLLANPEALAKLVGDV